MKKKIQVGIIGLGEQSFNNILPSLIFNNITNIKTVCDLDKTKLEKAKDLLGDVILYQDYQDMLSSEQLDVVFVVCPPQTHMEVIKYCALRKIACFVEKPPCTTLSELHELIKIAYAIPVFVGMNFRFMSFVNKIKEITKTTEFDDFSYFSINHTSNKPKENMWNLDSLLRSFLLAQAIHPIDLAIQFGGKYKNIDYSIKHYKNSIYLNLFIEFINGKHANIFTSNGFSQYEFNFKIISSRNNIIDIDDLNTIKVFGEMSNQLFPPFKRWHKVWTPSPLNNGFENNGYFSQIENCISSILNRNHINSASLESLVPVFEIIEIIDNSIL